MLLRSIKPQTKSWPLCAALAKHQRIWAINPNGQSRLPWLLSCWLSAVLCLPAGLAAAEGYSAKAQFFPGGEIHAADQAPSKLAAANQALTACRTKHNNNEGYCDIVELSGDPVHSAAQLKAGIPPQRYPLYLWHIQHGQSEVYLAGSIHLLKPGFYPLPPQYESAFERTENLVFEVDVKKLSAAELQQQSLRYGSLPRGTTLNQVLPADIYQGLSARLLEYGAPIANFHAFKPNLVTQQLALLALLSVGYNPEIGLENYFRSRAASKTILELESFEFQMNMLMNPDLDTQRELTALMLQQMSDFEATTAQLVSAWLAGDDGVFADITHSQQGTTPRLRAYGRALIEQRNHSMADTVVGYLNSPGSYFVLVGAAHLIGTEGIPALLEKKGYPTQRIFSDQALGTPTGIATPQQP